MNPLRRFRFRQRVDLTPGRLAASFRRLERMADWVPALERSVLLAREGDVSVCELVFRDASRATTLEVIFAEDRSIRFTEVDRLPGRRLRGELRLAEDARGGTLLDLECRLPGWGLLPAARRRLRDALLQATGALARDAGPLRAERPAGVLVELVARGDDLRVHVAGREYRLVPESGR